MKMKPLCQRIIITPPPLLRYSTPKVVLEMKFDIRLATLDDAKCCADIHAESWNFAYSDIVPNEIINEHNAKWPLIWNKMLTYNIDSHYVIVLDGVIIGFLTITISRDNDLKESFYEIVGLYLSPNYIGLGFGKRAMDWIKREIKKRGYNSIFLWVLQANNRAIAFYEKSGFISDGKVKPSGLADTREVRYICKCE